MALSTRSAFLGGFLLWAVPALAWRALLLAGIGSWTTLGLGIFIAFPVLVIALFASAFRALPRARAAATATSAAALGLFTGICFTEVVSAIWRMTAFEWATQRAQPLVQAIARYELENGNPPAHLDALVPQYLDRNPGRIPPLEIVVTLDYPPNKWLLRADAGNGFLNWDELLYLSHENYDEFSWGGSIQRLGTWAYLHE